MEIVGVFFAPTGKCMSLAAIREEEEKELTTGIKNRCCRVVELYEKLTGTWGTSNGSNVDFSASHRETINSRSANFTWKRSNSRSVQYTLKRRSRSEVLTLEPTDLPASNSGVQMVEAPTTLRTAEYSRSERSKCTLQTFQSKCSLTSKAFNQPKRLFHLQSLNQNRSAYLVFRIHCCCS